MKLESAYPVVVTDHVAACRDFYVHRLGFEVIFEATWFAYLACGAVGVAFMTPDHPSQPPGPARFSGEGMFLTLQVADAAAEFARLTHAGTEFAYGLADEPWGQRRFALRDPAGMWIDVVEQIAPKPGFWDPYV
jgi:catechol 2,3-dioxygenase-like lactoylglutathione lyase family enzyme